MGDAVNVAARLQAAAAAGGILVGERTQRLSARGVVYRELEPLALKGKARARRGMGSARGRRAGRTRAGSRAATPLVGREEELARLESAVRTRGQRRTRRTS